MKCPNCNEEIQDNFRFCPNCRTRIVVDQVDSKSVPSNSGSKQEPATPQGINEFVKGMAILSLSQGEIARKIKESEFAQMDTLRGFIIEDGVCALLSINGEIAEVESGRYNLVNDSQINLGLNQPIAQGEPKKLGFIDRVKRFWSSIKNFITRKKDKPAQPQQSASHLSIDQRIDNVVRNLTRNTIVSLYLRCKRNFTILIGCTISGNGAIQFSPLRIRTKYCDVNVGVSMSLRISDTREFIDNYMQGRKSLSPYVIQEELAPYASTILQEELADYEMVDNKIDPSIKSRIISRIMSLTSVMKGIEVVSVIELSCNGEDLERFREVSRQLYFSEKEIDYLQRTNELKNRMVDVTNAQKLNEARNAFELKVALDNLNKDNLLHQDELEQFAEQLAQEKQKRNISIEMICIEQLATLAMKKTEVEKKILHHQMLADTETDDLKYELYKKKRERQLDELDFEQVIYGKKFLIEKQRLADAWQREDELMVREYKNMMFATDSETELMKKKLEQDSIISNHAFNQAQQQSDFAFNQAQRQTDFNFANTKRQDDYNFDNLRRNQELQMEMERKKREMEMEELRQKQQMSMQSMQAMLDMDIKLSNNDHRNQMEADNAQKAFDLEKERMRHEEQLNKDNLEFQLGMQQSDNLTRMGADQIAASQLSKLTPEQAAAYSEMFSSRKEAKAKEDMLQFANERNQQSHDDMMNMMNQNRQDMQNMMAMMMQGMQNMASMNMQNMQSMSNMNMQTQQNMMSMQQSAMQQQINDTKQMKEEYRQQAIHQQERTDQNQQQSLNYTTLVQTDGASAGSNDRDKKNDSKEEKK